MLFFPKTRRRTTSSGTIRSPSAAIDKGNLSPEAAKRFPNNPLPVACLARLAVDPGARGQGFGEHLLMDALHGCLRVAHEVGVVVVLVDAKDDKAKRFYARYVA